LCRRLGVLGDLVNQRRGDELFAGRKPPVQGRDAHSGPQRYLLKWRLQALRGEHIPGRREDGLAVARRIRAQRPRLHCSRTASGLTGRRGPVWHYPVWRSHLIPPRHRSIVDHVEGLLRKLLGWRSGAIPPYLCSVRPDWSMTVEPSPQEWIGALRRSHDALRANVEPLDERTLRQGSYCSEWSI